MPKRGSPPVSRRDVRVQVGDQHWTGSYEVERGRLILSSAWGSRVEPIEPGATSADLKARATSMLLGILNARGVG